MVALRGPPLWFSCCSSQASSSPWTLSTAGHTLVRASGCRAQGARQCSAPAPTGQPARKARGLRGTMACPRPSWALAAVLAVFQGGSLSGRGMCAALPPIAGKVACSRARRAIPQGSSRMRRAAESPARAWASGFSPAGGKMPQKADGGKLSIPCASSA